MHVHVGLGDWTLGLLGVAAGAFYPWSIPQPVESVFLLKVIMPISIELLEGRLRQCKLKINKSKQMNGYLVKYHSGCFCDSVWNEI